MDNNAAAGWVVRSNLDGILKEKKTMKKFLAVLSLSTLLALPVWADEAAAPAVDKAAPVASSSADETAPAVAPAEGAAPAMKKAKAGKSSGVDEAGIKKAFSAVSAAWAAGDAKALVKNFTPDASIINPMGIEGWGREEAEKVVAADLEMFKGTTQTFGDFKFTYVMSNMVLVDCSATLSGGPDGDKKMHLFAVVVNRGKAWQARVIRPYAFMPTPGSAPAAAAPAAAAPAPAGASVPPAADVAPPKMDKGK